MANRKIAYLINNIEEYGNLMAFCIEHDISVWRSYWDDREKGDRCYVIDWQQKRCFYSPRKYYIMEGYEIVTPRFYMDKYGVCKIWETDR